MFYSILALPAEGTVNNSIEHLNHSLVEHGLASFLFVSLLNEYRTKTKAGRSEWKETRGKKRINLLSKWPTVRNKRSFWPGPSRSVKKKLRYTGLCINATLRDRHRCSYRYCRNQRPCGEYKRDCRYERYRNVWKIRKQTRTNVRELVRFVRSRSCDRLYLPLRLLNPWSVEYSRPWILPVRTPSIDYSKRKS